MSKYNMFLNLIVVVALLLSSTAPVLAGPTTPQEPAMSLMKQAMAEAQSALTPAATAHPKTRGVNLEELVPLKADEVVNMDEPAFYIIQLEDAPLATYAGGVGRMAATSAPARGERKLNVTSPAAIVYRNYLKNKQSQFLNVAEKTLKRAVDARFQYQLAYNGVAMEMSAVEAAEIAKLPGVRKVTRSVMRYPTTDAGPTWIGASGVWDGSAAYTETMGEDIVIGVIDTGINSDHPSFAEVGPTDSYVHVNPLGAGVYLGVCTSPTSTFQCNNKLIGAYDFADGITNDPIGEGPEDSDGHGSHTSSTAAGNILEDISFALGTTTITASISGVAPHANIIIYDTCGTDNMPGVNGCPNVATLAAIDQAIDNSVDVINYSIGGGPQNPWDDPDSEAFLAARNAGIYVSISAGNDGPGAGTVGSPANSPWAQTLGNASHNRMFANTISFGGVITPLATMSGTAISAAYGPAPIVHAGDFGDPLCGTAFLTDTWTHGEIVVCDRGQFALVDKVANAHAGGAGAVVIANADFNGETTASIPHELPSIHIGYNDAELLRAWLASGSGHTATISESDIDINDAYGDRMAAGSSRGPNLPAPDVIKPDLIAPGTDILAAYRNGVEYNVIGGTSMAAPHGAGAGILMRALYPDWTEAQIQSAIMSTAISDQALKEDWLTAADPFDDGAGRIFVSNAARAGFVLDETYDNYVAADPAAGGDPSTLNLASLGQDECLGTCTWQRTISSTVAYPVTWTTSYAGATGLTVTVNPPSFVLAPYGTQVLEIEADVSAFPVTETWQFAEVIFTPDTTDVSVAHFPVAVDPTSGIIPDEIEVTTRRDAGSTLVEDLKTIEVSDLTVESFGLVAPTMQEFFLPEVTDNSLDFPDIFFQGGPGIEFVTVTVPADAPRFVARIYDTTSPDLDMIVFLDSNDNGIPEAADIVNTPATFCQSASNGSREMCDIMYPAAGRWYVSVLNYTESATPPDDVMLAVAVPSSDAGNLTVTGPTSVPSAELYDLRVYWNEPMMEAGETWYGMITLGSDPGNPGNIGAIPVTIHREADDVVKTVNQEEVSEGDIVTFSITVEPNVTAEDLVYMITDTLPAGLSYVPGSLQASDGVAAESNGVITWTGSPASAPVSIPRYLVSTSDTDPLCDTGFGGYVNLAGFGIPPQAGITGDTGTWTALTGQHPFQFYGIDNTGVSFTDDGFAFFDSTPGDEPWTNTDLPDPNDPNDMLAMLWADGEIVYDGTPGQYAGVSIATANAEISIIEYDDLYNYPAEDDSIMGDVEVVFYSTIDNSPGAYEMIVAYDNIQDLPNSVTVGTENANGSEATRFLYGDPTGVITDGLMVCFDYTVYTPATPDPVLITYQAEVEIGAWDLGTITNTAYHNTDNAGSMEAGADAVLDVTGRGYTLTVDIVGEGNVTRTPDQIRYLPGAEVRLDAIPDQGWEFQSWDGASSLLITPITITMNSDAVITATFVALPTYTLDINVTGNGTVAVNPDNDFYYAGDVIELTATPGQDWVFDDWSGDLSGTENPISFTIVSDMGVTANFTAIPTYTLDVRVVGNGSVTQDPNAAYYLEGASVELTAVPDTNWHFAGWSGDLGGSDNPANIMMDGNKVVTATFTQEAPTFFTLTVDVVGSGSVTKSPSATTYLSGSVVTLQGVPATGWEFDSWSGALSGTTNPTDITMDGDKLVTATFTALPTYMLDVNIVGQGEVAADPDLQEYAEGTVVELTATPEMGWEFTGWSGDLSGTENPISFTIVSDMEVTATFTAIPTYTLVVNVVGNGSVNRDPDAAYYLEGESVELTAIPDTDWYFLEWSGDLGGSDNPASITMDGNKVVTVTFTQEEPTFFTLTTNVVGSGSVTKSPSATTYISGSLVQLTGMPAAGWEFSAWSGDVVTTTNPIAIVMDANKTVTATFVEMEEEILIYLPLVSKQYQN
ncbi:MAG: S8 family serine peptidase [Anaerolineae bacterium]|nr:S8 family serine peptidase [Anaerolineae bacterium]